MKDHAHLTRRALLGRSAVFSSSVLVATGCAADSASGTNGPAGSTKHPGVRITHYGIERVLERTKPVIGAEGSVIVLTLTKIAPDRKSARFSVYDGSEDMLYRGWVWVGEYFGFATRQIGQSGVKLIAIRDDSVVIEQYGASYESHGK